MKKIALLFSTLILLLVSSCSSTTSLSDSNHPITPLANANTGSYCYLRGDILQAFNSKEALGKDNDIVVKLVTNEDTSMMVKSFQVFIL